MSPTRKEKKAQKKKLQTAYKAQDQTGKNTQTVGGSALPCKKAKAALEITIMSSTDDRDIEEGKVTFTSGGKQLERTTNDDGRAFLPLKKAALVSVIAVVTNPAAAAFEEQRGSDSFNVADGELKKHTFQFTPKATRYRVLVLIDGSDPEKGVPGAKVSLKGTGDPIEQTVADDTGETIFEGLFEEDYEVSFKVKEEDWKPIEKFDVKLPIGARKFKKVKTKKANFVIVRVQNAKKNDEALEAITVKLEQDGKPKQEADTDDKGTVEFKLPKDPPDGKPKITQLNEDGGDWYEFVSYGES